MAVLRRFQYLEDQELVGIAQLGSGEACDELVRRFRSAVLLTAEQVLGCRESAHDVAQEAFLLAFRALPDLQDAGKFAGWLHAITRNRARRAAIQNGRSQTVQASALEHLLTQQGGFEEDPLDQVLWEERQDAIQALLSDLPPEIQIVLQLFYYEQWTAARIADFLSLPLTTIKWRLHAGRARLCPRLAEYLEENPHARTQLEAGDTPNTRPAAENGRAGRTRGANRQLRKQRAQLCEAV